MSDDLISRQAAIDELKECRKIYCDNTPESFSLLGHSDKSRVDEIDNAIAILVDLPSAQRWIPVSERLPDNERYVLVTTVSGDVIDAKYWQKEGLWVSDLTIISVIAWMPLPEPYKER